MATYTLISSNVLTSSASSVTFSAIPSTYTDLVVRASVRADHANAEISFSMKLNGAVASNMSGTRLKGDGSSASSGRQTADTAIALQDTNAAGSTASSFTSFEVYLPNYLTTVGKPISAIISAEENVGNPVTTTANAILFNNTSAITSVSFNRGADNWVTGSSFYLYGISNA
jgi:hypothetical protein